MQAENIKYLYGSFTKRDSAQHVVEGFISSGNLDLEGQIIDPDWLKQELPPWFQDWGNIRQQHDPQRAVGRATNLKTDADPGPWIRAKIVDPDAWLKCEEKVYNGFSVGIKNPVIVDDPAAPGGRIVGGTLIEVSIVDRPANNDAKFTLVRSAGPGEWKDMQTGITLAKEAVQKREVSPQERRQLAGRGQALPGGGYPIANVGDLQNAIRAIGRAKDPAKTKAHIIRRAKALGRTDLLPADWPGSTKKENTMSRSRGSSRKAAGEVALRDAEAEVEAEVEAEGTTEAEAEAEAEVEAEAEAAGYGSYGKRLKALKKRRVQREAEAEAEAEATTEAEAEGEADAEAEAEAEAESEADAEAAAKAVRKALYNPGKGQANPKPPAGHNLQSKEADAEADAEAEVEAEAEAESHVYVDQGGEHAPGEQDNGPVFGGDEGEPDADDKDAEADAEAEVEAAVQAMKEAAMNCGMKVSDAQAEAMVEAMYSAEAEGQGGMLTPPTLPMPKKPAPGGKPGGPGVAGLPVRVDAKKGGVSRKAAGDFAKQYSTPAKPPKPAGLKESSIDAKLSAIVSRMESLAGQTDPDRDGDVEFPNEDEAKESRTPPRRDFTDTRIKTDTPKPLEMGWSAKLTPQVVRALLGDPTFMRAIRIEIAKAATITKSLNADTLQTVAQVSQYAGDVAKALKLIADDAKARSDEVDGVKTALVETTKRLAKVEKMAAPPKGQLVSVDKGIMLQPDVYKAVLEDGTPAKYGNEMEEVAQRLAKMDEHERMKFMAEVTKALTSN